MRLRDELAAQNERIKLRAATFNAIALGLIGFALLRPVTEQPASLGWPNLWWCLVGLAFHGIAHYILGQLRKADP